MRIRGLPDDPPIDERLEEERVRSNATFLQVVDASTEMGSVTNARPITSAMCASRLESTGRISTTARAYDGAAIGIEGSCA